MANICVIDCRKATGTRVYIYRQSKLLNRKPLSDRAPIREQLLLSMEESRISVSELAAVLCTIGPGSYTGLRCGMAAAKALAFALEIPLYGIDSLQLLAYSSQKDTNGQQHPSPMDTNAWKANALVYCLLPANTNEYYFAAYQFDETAQICTQAYAPDIFDEQTLTWVHENKNAVQKRFVCCAAEHLPPHFPNHVERIRVGAFHNAAEILCGNLSTHTQQMHYINCEPFYIKRPRTTTPKQPF